MNIIRILLLILMITFGQCEFLTIGVLGVIGSSTYYGYKTYIHCRIFECCNDNYVKYDIQALNAILQNALYGQPLVLKAVISALHGHVNTDNPPKALALSFHGTPGVGKNYVAQMIYTTFYNKGLESNYVHFFRGRIDFPLDQKIETYKVDLRDKIVNSLSQCERSIFIFDEVDKMPEGLLNVLVPFLDYNTWHKSFKNNQVINTTKAIYIFLSNTGGNKIVNQMVKFWEQGKSRDQLTVEDFENLISTGAFNEKGGFYYSDTIASSLIDHYIPFLPLEELHVKQCIEKAFVKHSVKPTKELIDDVLSHVTYGPSPHQLYAKAGCKRLEQKVALVVYTMSKLSS